MLSLLLTAMLGTKNIDVLGHLGGFLTGIVAGLWLLPALETSMDKLERTRKVNKWSKVATFVWLTTMLVCFYAFRTPVDKFGNSASLSGSAKELQEIKAQIEQAIADENAQLSSLADEQQEPVNAQTTSEVEDFLSDEDANETLAQSEDSLDD